MIANSVPSEKAKGGSSAPAASSLDLRFFM